MKKLVLAMLIAAVVFTQIGCGIGPAGGPAANRANTLLETADTPEPEKAESEGENYSNVVFYAGDDIPVGSYIVTCTGTDSMLEVVVFANEETYDGFQSADKFTNGDYRTAVEQYAWADFNLDQDENAYVGLQDGYIILLDDGRCEFTKYDPAASQTVYPGIYVVGEDLNAEKINIKCTDDYMQVTQFGTKDSYLEYHKMSRYTRGEEDDAIEAHADCTDSLNTDDITYVNLQDGMVLMVEDGVGELSVAEGPIIH